MKVATFFGWGATIIVISTIVLAFLIVGSPNVARQRRADAQRIEHLHELVRKINTAYQREKKLPNNLENFRSSNYLSGKELFRDPSTGKPFGYRIVDDKNYELSAVFETDDEYKGHLSGMDLGPTFAKHPAGAMTLQFDASIKRDGY